MFHRDVSAPVLERDQEPVFDSQFRGRFAAALMKCVEGFLENFQHLVKGLPFDSEESFELPVADREVFCTCSEKISITVKRKKIGLDGG